MNKLYLQEAIECIAGSGIELYGVNNNPSQINWSRSPKAYCDIYIDDAAFGVPLLYVPDVCSRPFVNWDVVGPTVLGLVERHYA